MQIPRISSLFGSRSLGGGRLAISLGAHGVYHFNMLLAPGEYQILLVEAPNVPADEMKTAIRWKIKDSLSYHVDNATVDVLQIPASKSGPARAPSLYAIAAANDIIQKHMALFEQAKLKLDVIDVPEMAQRNIRSE